ncbi:hypothetical protein NBRC111894_1811 [Sporolactobacillus inulinus]|uniref:Uncharacterized protein n=1 Tax=Sporolactobacillus inulinus TaxID=2078 RepID=A0A4Y1ZB17_9BACL|nr:hypothetical protein NBRC111894_1811 [Sporolactobacillus inulinus]
MHDFRLRLCVCLNYTGFSGAMAKVFDADSQKLSDHRFGAAHCVESGCSH